MKKLLLFAAIVICAVSCATKGDTQPQTPKSYTLFCGYSPATELQQRLSFDARLTETFFFYEYDANNNKIDFKQWDKPILNSEKTFIANDGAARVVVYYELCGYARDGSTITDYFYFEDVVNLIDNSNVKFNFSASTRCISRNPIK